jgi:hypothetical protein
MIQTYSDLQAAVIEYIARDQDTVFIARIPTFVQSFEAKANRLLFVRQMEQRSTAVVDITQPDPEYIALPTDFQSMRRARVSSASRKPPLSFMSGEQIEEFRAYRGDAPGFPQYFTIFGSEIELCPTPGEDCTIEMIYRQNVPPLSANATNWLLTLAPDLYLYGALMETAPYIKEDARLQTWGTAFQTALDALNNLGLTSTFNAGPVAVRISGVTP